MMMMTMTMMTMIMMMIIMMLMMLLMMMMMMMMAMAMRIMMMMIIIIIMKCAQFPYIWICLHRHTCYRDKFALSRQDSIVCYRHKFALPRQEDDDEDATIDPQWPISFGARPCQPSNQAHVVFLRVAPSWQPVQIGRHALHGDFALSRQYCIHKPAAHNDDDD